MFAVEVVHVDEQEFRCQSSQARTARGRGAWAFDSSQPTAAPPPGAIVAQNSAPITAEEALRQAEAEGLTLETSEGQTGFKGVYMNSTNSFERMYQAKVRRGGRTLVVGGYVTAEEAALWRARDIEAHGPPESRDKTEALKLDAEAERFLLAVHAAFDDEPTKYRHFMEVMMRFQLGAIDTAEVMQEVASTLADHPNLIDAFNAFLPPGYCLDRPRV